MECSFLHYPVESAQSTMSSETEDDISRNVEFKTQCREETGQRQRARKSKRNKIPEDVRKKGTFTCSVMKDKKGGMERERERERMERETLKREKRCLESSCLWMSESMNGSTQVHRETQVISFLWFEGRFIFTACARVMDSIASSNQV